VDQARELDELRRLAYSRSGTEDDRRRLAQLESSIPAVTTSLPEEVLANEPVGERPDGEDPDNSATDDSRTDRPPIRNSRWLAAGAGAAVGAALASAIALALGAVNAQEPEPKPVLASALSVFDREPLDADDPANLWLSLDQLVVSTGGSTPADVDDLTLRWVGRAAGNDVYAVRWREEDANTICLVVVSADQGGSACTPESDFATNGIRMSALGVEVKWGPSGTEVWVNTFR
jgi:hypothetical protein